MEPNRERMKGGYRPFLRLAILNAISYSIFFSAFVIAILVLMHVNGAEKLGFSTWIYAIAPYVLFMIRAIWIPVLSLIEKKLKGYDKLLVMIKEWDTDGLYGDYKGSNQEVKYCYPKEIEAKRIKLVCRDENGRKMKFRFIISKKKLDMIEKTLINKRKVYITYGKLTRIIFDIESEYDEPTTCKNSESVKWINRIF